MSLLRIRARNLVDRLTERGADYWNRPEFHTTAVAITANGQEVETNPLLFSPIDALAFRSCMIACLMSAMLLPFAVASLAFLILEPGSIGGLFNFAGLILLVGAFLTSLCQATYSIRFLQLCPVMDADGVFDDVFDNGSGIGADNEDEGEEDSEEDEPEPEELSVEEPDASDDDTVIPWRAS